MKLRNTKLGAWLALVRIQGSPLTPIALLIGYATVSNSIITTDVIPLIIIGTLGQWAVYILNDRHDYEYDLDAKNNDKPLVSGDIDTNTAGLAGITLSIYVLYGAYLSFPINSFIIFLLAFIVGIIYNLRSKTDEFRSLYMFIWGILIIFTGGSYAGRYTIYTFLTALIFGIFMMWIIWMDGLKDLGTGQPSIPEKMNAHLYIKNGKTMIFGSYQFSILTLLVLSLEGLLLLLIPIIKYYYTLDIFWLVHITVSSFLIYLMIISGFNLVYHGEFNRSEIKKDIAKHTSIGVISMLFISLTFLDIFSIIIMLLGSVIWGLLWTKIMYGELFYFP